MSWLSAIPIVGSVVSGIQTRSAINNAEDALLKSYDEAGGVAQEAVDRVNPQILKIASDWGNNVMGAGDAAATGATDAANKGIDSINAAVSAGQAGVSPYIDAGTSSLAALTKMLTKPDAFQFQADPGYQFRLAEGQKAIQRSAAAHGAAGGGGTAKALAQYNSGLASQEYGNAWNRWSDSNKTRQVGLTQVAGMGERAGEFSGSLGLTGANAGALLGQRAAEYAGTMRTGTTQWAGTNNINAVDKTSANSLNLANFLANLKLQGGKTRAGADLGRADVWNNVIGSVTGANWGSIFSGGGKKGGGGGGGIFDSNGNYIGE